MDIPIPPAILCLGSSGSGKSTLLRNLQLRDDPILARETVSTKGTNLSIITRKKGRSEGVKDDTVVIRELGGAMVQLWASFIEAGNTRGIIYVIDASEPETLGKATIHLLEFLNNEYLGPHVEVLIIFSKTDIKCSRSLSEFKFIMRLNQIVASCKMPITHVEFNAESQKNQDVILEWCLKFSTFC